jgi:predicted alpha/beta-fold hydrolase
LRPFQPLIANPHVLTIAGNFWSRKLDTLRFPVEAKLYETEPGIQVLVQSQRPSGHVKGEIVLVHGLEGSGEAGYMRSLAQAGLESGFAVNRFHLRTCGGTEHLCRTLYHAGLTSDLLAILREYQKQGRTPVHLVGFSLGGNMVLKLAGELSHRAGDLIADVCAVSTPIDLAACAERMNEWDNRLYQERFLKRMRKRLIATGRSHRSEVRRLRSIFELDDRFTAPSFGFRSAGHYYSTQSSKDFLHAIRVPALVIQAKDDTFVPFRIFAHAAFSENPSLQLLTPDHGGHLGFISRRRPRFWVDQVVLEWISGHLQEPAN